jgi:hypothetical protein
MRHATSARKLCFGIVWRVRADVTLGCDHCSYGKGAPATKRNLMGPLVSVLRDHREYRRREMTICYAKNLLAVCSFEGTKVKLIAARTDTKVSSIPSSN